MQMNLQIFLVFNSMDDTIKLPPLLQIDALRKHKLTNLHW